MLESEICNSKSTIDLESYIFADDILGKRIAKLLIAAAERGIRIRLIIDGVGSPGWSYSFRQPFEQAGIAVRVFNPLPWAISSLNRRNHRKNCILDDRIAFLGSINISACHLKSCLGEKAWRDTAVRLEGDGIPTLARAFEHTWRHSVPFIGQKTFNRRKEIKRLRPLRSPLVRLNNTWPRRHRIYKDLIGRIQGAQKRIWVTNPYFLPPNGIIEVLCEAAGRGVDVRLLLPRQSDVFFMHWVSSEFYERLLRGGVRIFEYLPRVLHAKTLIIDNWVSTGSSNMNHRSLLHDLEVDVVLTHRKSRLSIEEQFTDDIQHSQEITLDLLQGQSLMDLVGMDHSTLPEFIMRQPWFEKLAGSMLFNLRYWM